MRVYWKLAIVMAIVSFAGCKDGTSPDVNNSNKVTVSVTLGNVGISSGSFTLGMCPATGFPQTKQLSAILVPDTSSVAIVWLSGDTTVVKVSSTGLVTAVGPGSFRIFVKAGSSMDYVDGEVLKCPPSAPGVRTIELLPHGGSGQLGETLQSTVICRIDGSVVSCVPKWYSKDETKVLVNPNTGLITYVSLGTGDVCAQWSATETSPSQCWPFVTTGTTLGVGEIRPLNFTLYMPGCSDLGLSYKQFNYYVDGSLKAASSATWSVQGSAVTVVQGLVYAQTPGTFTIQATHSQASNTATATGEVKACPSQPTSLWVDMEPGSRACVATGLTSFSASVQYTGPVPSSTAVTWSVSDTTVARIESSGSNIASVRCKKVGITPIYARAVADQSKFDTGLIQVESTTTVTCPASLDYKEPGGTRTRGSSEVVSAVYTGPLPSGCRIIVSENTDPNIVGMKGDAQILIDGKLIESSGLSFVASARNLGTNKIGLEFVRVQSDGKWVRTGVSSPLYTWTVTN